MMNTYNSFFLDFHTHHLQRKDRNDIQEIVSLHLGKEDVEYDYYTIGKHPWWTETVLSGAEIKALKQHFKHEECLAMGEMGLDKFKRKSMNIQMDILRSQLDLAREIDTPVIIHCVRATDALLQIKKEYPEIKKWCIHGFSRHGILAQQLIDKGFYLSLMPVSRINDKYIRLLEILPRDRFFLETDSMPNVLIENIYLQVKNVIGISLDELKQQMIENARTFFENE